MPRSGSWPANSNPLLRTLIRENGGTPIEGKLLGDGVLAVFTSARDAIAAALACARAGESAALPMHLGIHAGDVIREQNNVYGGAVNIAARIADASAAPATSMRVAPPSSKHMGGGPHQLHR